jgi:hypothetical protein
MTVDALAGGAVGFAIALLIDMAISTEIVELIFDEVFDCRIGFVAIKTHSSTGIVYKVMVTGYA